MEVSLIMQVSQILAEAEKSNSPLTMALRKKIKQINAEKVELEKSFNAETFIRNNESLQRQLNKINQEIAEQEKSFHRLVAEKAKNNAELGKLFSEEQQLIVLFNEQLENNSRNAEGLERINAQISNLNEEKLRRDKVFEDYYEEKESYENLQKEYEQKCEEFKIYGPEAEKKLKKVSELEPKIRDLKKAIRDVEPAVKEIRDLLENDHFDDLVNHK